MTECIRECIQERFEFRGHFSRRIEARFDSGQVSSDDGASFLREVDRKIGPMERVTACFTDRRSQDRIEHPLAEMLPRRLYALALGYEDLEESRSAKRSIGLCDVGERARRRATAAGIISRA